MQLHSLEAEHSWIQGSRDAIWVCLLARVLWVGDRFRLHVVEGSAGGHVSMEEGVVFRSRNRCPRIRSRWLILA